MMLCHVGFFILFPKYKFISNLIHIICTMRGCMWEITLIGERQDWGYFILLQDLLREKLQSPPLVAISEKSNLLCSIALENKKQLKMVKKIILEIVIRICKEEYYKENLNIWGSDNDLNQFILISLVAIGIQDEVDFARVKINLSKTIHIRSLVRFRLARFYTLWDKLVKYFNLRFSNGIQDDIYLEFLKFLAENNTSKGEILYLVQKLDEICILDKNRNVISSIPKHDEIGVVVSLISYAPKKLVVDCYSVLSSKIAWLIKYIFQDKICIVL